MPRTIREILVGRTTAGQVDHVDKLIGYARDLLQRVVETLPTYTLHDERHAKNVVALMEKLLGDRVEDLTALEAAMLLLSAYFHDIGLVYSEAERASLREAPDFAEFLREHRATALVVRRAPDGPLPAEVAERYCRWAHAKRVAVHLQDESLAPLLRWGVTDLTPYLRDVCQSHGWDTDKLHDDRRFPTDFLAEGDLRMCAILLRLADIMDFDRSRSPAAVYGYLGLADATSPREQASDREWRKHYDSDGFRFPVGTRESGYPLAFVAAPDEPGVEHDIREFLDVIEWELEACRRELRYCDDRWRGLSLPGPIRRDNIRGRGYHYGPYRFDLDRSEVLRLFTGESLYANRYVFIRELLQNALDTSRHRVIAEQHRTGRPFDPDPVRVRDWRDAEGRLWVQVEDGGQGMDERILVEYFLRLGRSYYTSDEFKAELLDYAPGEGGEFLPISRFGIGVLSCFIVADRVELSSLRAGSDAPIRLSMWGHDGFYALQVGPDQVARRMPGDRPGYRSRPGTTIAVRLDSRRETGDLDVAALLRQWVAFPAVPVEYDGHRIGQDPSLLDHCPQETLRVPLPPRMRAALERQFAERELPVPFDDTIALCFTPIDLTAASPTPEIRGQLFAVRLVGVSRVPDRTAGEREVMVVRGAHDRPPRVVVQIGVPAVARGPRFIGAAVAFDDLLVGQDDWRSHLSGLVAPEFVLSHNGIALPKGTSLDADMRMSFPSVGMPGDDPGLWDAQVFGHLALSDGLRPDVDVSRGGVRSVPWPALSAVALAWHRAVTRAGFAAPMAHVIRESGLQSGPSRMVPSLGELLADPLLRADDGWPTEQIISTSEGRMAIRQLTVDTRLESVPYFGAVRSHVDDAFYSGCVAAMLASRTRLAVVGSGREWSTTIEEATPAQLADGERLFPPLCFLPYRGSDAFCGFGLPVNRDHPVSKWIIDVAPLIQERHPGLMASLGNALKRSSRGSTREINEVLDRLGSLGSGVAPPKSLRLNGSDLAIGRLR